MGAPFLRLGTRGVRWRSPRPAKRVVVSPPRTMSMKMRRDRRHQTTATSSSTGRSAKLAARGCSRRNSTPRSSTGRSTSPCIRPRTFPPGFRTIFAVAGYLPREDVRDALISDRAASLSDLPKGARVGTASAPRRATETPAPRFRDAATARQCRDATTQGAGRRDRRHLCWLAGLKRLGLADRATAVLEISDFFRPSGRARSQ